MRITLSTVISIAVAAFVIGAGAPAQAAPPTIERIPIDESFPDEFLTEECGVEVFTTITGFRILRTFEDRTGRLLSVGTVNISGTATAEGGSFRFRDVGADVERIAPDGTTTLSIIGQLPFDFAGVLVINLDTGEVVKEPQFVRGTIQLERACEILRGA